MRIRPDVPGLRRFALLHELRKVFRVSADVGCFRLTEFSVQATHLHLICEADDARGLSRGMQGLAIRIARAVNRIFRRKGPVFATRYFVEQMDNPQKVRNGIVYVLQNFRHHVADPRGLGPVDDFSSALSFTGWRYPLPVFLRVNAPEPSVATAQTWLLRVGWMMHGKIRFDESPAERGRKRGSRRPDA